MNLASMLSSILAASAGGFFGENMQRVMPAALATVGLILLMLSMRRRQQLARRPPREPTIERPRHSDLELRRDLDALMVELQELSRKISAEIDTRFAKLEAAIRDADRRIAVLHRLSRDNGSRPVTPDDAGLDSRHAVVYELSDAGFSPVDIARELGKTPGEVELILNLRRTPASPRAEAGQSA